MSRWLWRDNGLTWQWFWRDSGFDVTMVLTWLSEQDTASWDMKPMLDSLRRTKLSREIYRVMFRSKMAWHWHHTFSWSYSLALWSGLEDKTPFAVAEDAELLQTRQNKHNLHRGGRNKRGAVEKFEQNGSRRSTVSRPPEDQQLTHKTLQA